MQTVKVHISEAIQTITLDRPEARNAFNDVMISELRQVLTSLTEDVRVVVLTGNGSAFCAGADVNWMRASIGLGEDGNRRDAARMEAMLRAIDECPVPVVGRINGTALGGGMGLVACCDIALAVEGARFGYTEVRLGIVPAVISPYSLAKIGQRAARRYFLTGEVFDAERAREIGLIHDIVPAGQFDEAIGKIVDALLGCGPQATRTVKKLIRDMTQMDRETVRDHTISTIARVRTSPEGQEGLSAFLEKRLPRWRRGE